MGIIDDWFDAAINTGILPIITQAVFSGKLPMNESWSGFSAVGVKIIR
jgi:hypothetical protein